MLNHNLLVSINDCCLLCCTHVWIAWLHLVGNLFVGTGRLMLGPCWSPLISRLNKLSILIFSSQGKCFSPWLSWWTQEEASFSYWEHENYIQYYNWKIDALFQLRTSAWVEGNPKTSYWSIYQIVNSNENTWIKYWGELYCFGTKN